MAYRELSALMLATTLLSGCSGGGGGGSQTPSPGPSPAPANAAPVLTTGNIDPIAENDTQAGYTETANDADGDTLTFSIDGDDAMALFIDSGTGEITFRQTPDFENPQDSNGDNVYEYDVTVSDGTATTRAARSLVVENRFETAAVLTIGFDTTAFDPTFGNSYVTLLKNSADGNDDLVVMQQLAPSAAFTIVDGASVHAFDGTGQVAEPSRSFPALGDGGVWLTAEDEAQYLAMAHTGDVDGDDIGDLFLVKIESQTDNRSVSILSGASLPAQEATVDAGSLVESDGLSIVTSPADDFFALYAMTAGDIDNEGRGDLLIYDTNNLAVSSDPGSVNMLLGVYTEGLTAGDIVDASDIPFTRDGFRLDDSSDVISSYQQAISGMGDLTGDGYPEFVVGTPLYDDYADTRRGGAFVIDGGYVAASSATPAQFPGSLSAVRIVPVLDSWPTGGITTGQTVKNLGDLDGDGLAELGIDAASRDAYIVYGSALRDAMGGDLPLEGLADRSEGIDLAFGVGALTGIDDLDADGQDEILITVERDTAANTDLRFLILFGGDLTAAALKGATVDDILGAGAIEIAHTLPQGLETVDGIGDFDGDGLVDILIRAKSEIGDTVLRDYIAISGQHIADVHASGSAQLDLTGLAPVP